MRKKKKRNLQVSGGESCSFLHCNSNPWTDCTMAGDTNMPEAKGSSTALIVDTAYRGEWDKHYISFPSMMIKFGIILLF